MSIFGSNFVWAFIFLVRYPCPTGPHGTKPIPSSSQADEHTVLLRVPLHQRIFRLDRCNRLDGVRPADSLRTRLGQTEVQNLSFFDQLFDCTCHIFDWYIRIDPVLVVEIDAIGSEALQ